MNFLVGKIGRDPVAWSDPMSFMPERYMAGGEGEGVDLTCTRGEIRMMPFGPSGPGGESARGSPRRCCLEYLVANLVGELEWWVLASNAKTTIWFMLDAENKGADP